MQIIFCIVCFVIGVLCGRHLASKGLFGMVFDKDAKSKLGLSPRKLDVLLAFLSIRRLAAKEMSEEDAANAMRKLVARMASKLGVRESDLADLSIEKRLEEARKISLRNKPQGVKVDFDQ